ncbi:MAG: zinc finger Ran-binding domain-containing protein [Gemmatimonadota bacterium]
MTESGHMDALTALLEERKQYETWIAQLDARRGSAPGHVLERVRGDYVTRLGQVTEQLVQRAPELRGSAHELAVRLAGLERDEGEKRDERAEYELRAAVGEYAPEVAQSSFARIDETITRLAGERNVVETELNRMRALLSAIDIAAAAIGAPAAHPIAHAVPSAPPAPPVHAEPARERPAVDELAFLKSVVPDSRLTPALATPQVQPPSPEIDEAAPNEVEERPAPSFTSQRRAAEPSRGSGHIAAPAMTPPSVPSILKDVPTEQVKTLRCQECGTMNYPTEWYCERCGGELAAM